MPSVQARFESMTKESLDAVLDIESQAYQHPWQRQHFVDCLASGYQAQLLMAGDTLLGYFVAMKGFGEVHLLNIAVQPRHQRQGWAQVMLDGLIVWARGLGMQSLWLETRASNTRAIHVYKASGFRHAGLRKQYYPADMGQREDALVMNLKLSESRHEP